MQQTGDVQRNALAVAVATWRRATPADVREASLAAEGWFELPGNRPPWQATGLRVRRGEACTVIAAGRVSWSRTHAARHGGPRFHLWVRIAPGGRARNLATEDLTFTADVDGEFELGLYMGMWADDRGTLATPASLYARLGGAIGCWVGVWRAPPPAGFERLTAAPEGAFLRPAHRHWLTPVPPPAGWHYLMETGHAEIFRERHVDGRREIHVDADDDQGILTTAVDFPLTATTALHWSWCADELPGTDAEHTTHTHDYVSIATEFDNGRDLTWMWSACLPVDTHFPCPVPAWRARETHLVARCGPAAPGTWFREQRWVQADVRRAMGPSPARIVRIWLIGLSTFQHGRLRARFAEIALIDADRRVGIL